MNDKKEFEIYIHLPFCKQKCEYCDFLSFPAEDTVKEAYVQALQKEICEEEELCGRIVTSIFIGGGTPSLLSANQVVGLMETVQAKYAVAQEAEITLEANPGTLTKEKLKAYREAGINRLSIGLQSAQNKELRELGRIHTWEEFQESFSLARQVGFTNINVDLMSALPGQSIATWKHTLKKVVELAPEHISAYSLIIEEGTPFFERYQEDVKRRAAGEICLTLPTEAAERQMYYDTAEILAAAGYHRYEISNYSLPGYECRHNCGYWKRKDCRGFGLGAASLLEPVRFYGTNDLQQYLRHDFPKVATMVLSKQEQMEEYLFLGLRLCEGISSAHFQETFHCAFADIYGETCEKLIREKLLWRSGEQFGLTERGIDLSNHVLSQFLF